MGSYGYPVNLEELRATSEIEAGEGCFVCQRTMKRRQVVVRILGGHFVHKTDCRNSWLARVAKSYGMSAKEIAEFAEVSIRTAYRVLEEVAQQEPE